MKKRALFASILFALTHTIFAAPSMNGPSGSHNAPSRPSPAPSPAPRRPVAPKTPKRPSNSSKSRETAQKNASAPSQQVSPNAPKTAKPEPPDSNAQIKSEDFVNYRGTRMSFPNDDFLLQRIKTERISDNNVNVEITFNQSINPRSFDYTTIKIDGESLSEQTTFSFNKKGDTVRVTVPVTNQNFTLEIQNIESFDGTTLMPIEIRDISDNSTDEDFFDKS